MDLPPLPRVCRYRGTEVTSTYSLVREEPNVAMDEMDHSEIASAR